MPDARKKKKKGKRKDGDGLVIRYIQLRGEEKQIIASSLLSYLYLSLLRAYPIHLTLAVNSFRSFPSRPVRNPWVTQSIFCRCRVERIFSHTMSAAESYGSQHLVMTCQVIVLETAARVRLHV